MNNNKLQRELATDTGLSLRYLQKIEAGKAELKIKTVSLFADVLNIPACYLLKDFDCRPQCPIQFGCNIELLDLLPFGIQLIDISAKVLYENKTQRDFVADKLNLKSSKTYFWDYFTDPEELKKIREHFESMVLTHRERSTLFSKFQLENGVDCPIKIELKLISTLDSKTMYFLNTIHYHPSW